jgi:hypothetical protein
VTRDVPCKGSAILRIYAMSDNRYYVECVYWLYSQPSSLAARVFPFFPFNSSAILSNSFCVKAPSTLNSSLINPAQLRV